LSSVLVQYVYVRHSTLCRPGRRWLSWAGGQAKRQMRHEQGVRAWTSCHRGAVEPQPSQPPSAVSSHASGSGSRASAGTWRWWPYELIDDVDLRMCRRARPCAVRPSRMRLRRHAMTAACVKADKGRGGRPSGGCRGSASTTLGDRTTGVAPWCGFPRLRLPLRLCVRACRPPFPSLPCCNRLHFSYWYRVMSRSSTAPQSITVCNGRLAADGSGDASTSAARGPRPPSLIFQAGAVVWTLDHLWLKLACACQASPRHLRVRHWGE